MNIWIKKFIFIYTLSSLISGGKAVCLTLKEKEGRITTSSSLISVYLTENSELFRECGGSHSGLFFPQKQKLLSLC